MADKEEAKYLTLIYIFFFSPGFLGWAAYSSSLLHILWFVSGNVISSQQTK